MSEDAASRTLFPKLASLPRFTFVDVVLWGIARRRRARRRGRHRRDLDQGPIWRRPMVRLPGFRRHDRQRLRPGRARLHHGLRRPAADQFRPWRHHDDRRLLGLFRRQLILPQPDFSIATRRWRCSRILAVAVSASTTIALLTERLAYRPFRHVRGLAPLICAIGVSFFLEQTFRGAFGSGIRAYPDPKWQRQTISIYGFSVPDRRRSGGDRRSRLDGDPLRHRAAHEDGNRDARGVGGRRHGRADGDRRRSRSWCSLSLWAARWPGIAGVCYAFVFKQVYFFMGFTPGIKAFGAAVLGGIGSVPGAMLGGSVSRHRRIRRTRRSSSTASAFPRPTSCATSSPSPCSSWF